MCDSVTSWQGDREKWSPWATHPHLPSIALVCSSGRSIPRRRLNKVMAKKSKAKSFEEAVSWFRDHEFEVIEAPGAPNRVFLKKYHCSAAIERSPDGSAKIFAYPGYLINGEISKLVDH